MKTFKEKPKSPWKWFQANLITDFVTFQDFVHLLVKLKSKLLLDSVLLPIGPIYVASKGHLEELINNSSIKKDQHELTISYLKDSDKMNFKAASKICSEKVSKLLRSKVWESEGTATYLDMMRDTFEAFADPSLTPQERISKSWRWIFFLRIWKMWILEHPDYTLAHNYPTSNAVFCAEINGHANIQLLVLNRDKETPHLYKPWLYSSQPCEERFRTARSLTSTLSTIINFSIMEMLHRERRVDFLMNATFKLKDKYVIPGNWRAFQPIKKQPFVCQVLPEDYEIQGIVENAFRIAMEDATKLEIIKCPLRNIPLFSAPLISDSNMTSPQGVDENDEDEDQVIQTGEDNDLLNMQEDMNEEIDEDVMEDLTISLGDYGLKTFDNVLVHPDGPFVRVPNSDGGTSIVKKSTLCWLLQNNCSTVSNDRLLRVRAEKSSAVKSSSRTIQVPVHENFVSIGSWCAFRENDQVIIGRILAFRFMSGTTVKNQEFRQSTAPVHPSSECSRSIGCMCSWFSPSSSGILKSVSMDSQGFYNLSNYLCTIPRPHHSDTKLKLACTVKSLKVFLNKR